MSIILNAPKLKPLLRPLSSVINRTTVLPVLECFHASFSNGEAVFTATDLENVIQLRTPVSSNGTTTNICIQSRILKTMVEKSLSEEIYIDLITKEKYNFAKLRSEQFSLQASIYNTEEFPKTPEISDTKSFTIDAAILAEYFKKAILFVSNDDLRPAMTGVYLHDRNKELYIAATDAHKLYWTSIIPTPDAMKKREIILPQKTVKLFLQIFKKGEVKIDIGDKHIIFSNSEYTQISRLVDARYPDYNAVLVNHELTFTLKRQQLKSFLAIAQTFLNRSTHQVKLTIHKDHIACDGGDADFDMELSYKLPLYNPSVPIWEPIQFGLNAQFLAQALTITNDEYVKINHPQNGTKAVVIDDVLLIMPLMLNTD